jgi:hypothetical protein
MVVRRTLGPKISSGGEAKIVGLIGTNVNPPNTFPDLPQQTNSLGRRLKTHGFFQGSPPGNCILATAARSHRSTGTEFWCPHAPIPHSPVHSRHPSYDQRQLRLHRSTWLLTDDRPGIPPYCPSSSRCSFRRVRRWSDSDICRLASWMSWADDKN